jgi:hypothetical protein
MREWNQLKMESHMLQREIEWHFNPPYASHMGGARERLIRSTRFHLKAIAQEQLLTDEQLHTFMTEVEKILNDRPITPVSDDPRDPTALTPSMLLLMKTNTSIPRWWKRVHYLTYVFWKRWLHEYLPTLQARQKWQRQTTNLRSGDVVLIAEENVPRGQWAFGRVVSVLEGLDGLVRSCVVKTRTSELVKPITKLCLLECSI